MVKPWQTLSTRSILTDRWINLRADDCLTQSGKEIAPYYVLSYPDWVFVIALTPDDQIVLVEQYRHGAAATCLEVPAGAIEAKDVGAEAAARRELAEETGFTAEDVRIVSCLYANPANQTNRVHTVLATGCRRVAKPALEDGEDGLTVHCIPVADVLAGLGSGVLSQSMHVAGLLLGLSAAGRITF
jgi:8-oxo-dGTP pyrophosphatase MutT (NUDIX family)